MSIKLREYQEEIIRDLRKSFYQGNRRVIMSSPTGSGKTIMFTYMAKRHLELGGSVLVVTHRKELLGQTGGSFEKFGLCPELITAGSSPDLSVSLHVSMVETLSRRLDDPQYVEFVASRSMIVIDEAHLNSFTKLFEHIGPGTVVVGATATPYRKGKSVPSLDEFYTDLIQKIDTPELIDLGYLARADSYGMSIDLSKIKRRGDDYDTAGYYEEHRTYQGVVDNWEKICPGTKTLLFSSQVKSSIRVCEEFNDRGYLAEHLDADTPKGERTRILEWFDKTPDAIVCNCGILTAGFDQPDIKTIILYFATTSLVKFLQVCGRGSRPAPNKNSFNILDFGNNISRMDFWEAPRTWYLKKFVSKREDKGPVKECPECSAMLPISAKICRYCGYEFPEKEKEDDLVIELEKLSKEEVMVRCKGLGNKDLVNLARAKLIHPFWVLHNKMDKNDAREFCKLMGYKPGFEHVNKDRFEVFKNRG